ncbi:MAG: DotU family type IV/VI secretion system protein [Betaproteobacteria bacterium]|nr:DotU family type IV/VI secretion system protein [Betaproteobacteria bacterium]
MAEASYDYLLLGRFAAFYEEVASIKLAVAEGRLPAYLGLNVEGAHLSAADAAARVSARLATLLRQQEHEVANSRSEAEIQAYRRAQYLMAALADEIFILDLEWIGRSVWLGELIEYKLFHTRNAGRHFFEMAAELLQAKVRSPLHVDMGAVFLLALQLGFQGMYRGSHGQMPLADLRRHLYRFIQTGQKSWDDAPVFYEAYDQLAVGVVEQRLAPLRPWYMAILFGALAYLGLSSMLWFYLVYPLMQQLSS